MPYNLLKPAEVLTAEDAQAILAAGAELTIPGPNGKPPTIKSAAVTAALELFSSRMRVGMGNSLDSLLAMHEMMEGTRADADDSAAWDDALQKEIDTEFYEALTGALGTELWELVTPRQLAAPGGPDEAAKLWVDGLVKLHRPAGPHMGKFLSSIGITQPMIDDIDARIAPRRTEAEARLKTEAAKNIGTEAGSFPPGYVRDANREALNAAQFGTNPPISNSVPLPPSSVPLPPGAIEVGSGLMLHEGVLSVVPAPPVAGLIQQAYDNLPPPVPAPPPSTPVQVTHAAPPPPPGLPPALAEITEALGLWYNEGGPDLDAFAKTLGVSTGTLRNYVNGRSQAKLTHNQARTIVVDIEEGVVALRKAADILSRIR